MMMNKIYFLFKKNRFHKKFIVNLHEIGLSYSHKDKP